MKRNILAIIVMVLVLASCNDDDGYDTYSRRLGNLEVLSDNPNDFQVILDNGDIVVPEKLSGDYSALADGTRVIVFYSLLSEQDGANNTKVLSSAVHDIDEVLDKGIIELTVENADSIGNDPIHVHSDDIWFSKNYLNVYFSYYGYKRVHYINMVKYENDSVDADGNLLLEFRHNANEDYYAYGYSGFVSFDMNSVAQTGVDSIPVSVQVVDYEGDTLIWKDTYYLNDEAPVTSLEKFSAIDEFVK